MTWVLISFDYTVLYTNNAERCEVADPFLLTERTQSQNLHGTFDPNIETSKNQNSHR